MKTTVLFITFALQAFILNAQIDPTTPWVWMKGDHSIDNFGIYGTKGVAVNSNKPGSRTSATTWSDINGNLWMFGGYGLGNSQQGHLNDFWKFETASNKWTWVSGDSSVQQYAIYGTQNVANIANKPGATYASVSWTDLNGNLWLFGGFGYTGDNIGFLNTLWKYNINTNSWTWVKGDVSIDQQGIYGSKGNEHANNKPGARYGSNTWIDASGNLWLYGGYGIDAFNETGFLNDLWKFNTVTNKWSWISGNNAIDRPAVYGQKGVSALSNKPGARYTSSSWKDADGNFWLFGGYGYDAVNYGNLNDLWKYNPATNTWVWISGDNIIDQTPVYGVQGSAGANNKPGGRTISTSWTDPNGELWLFGGYGIDASNNSGYLNDFWKFSPFTNMWTWVKGDNTVDQVGIYGTQGLPCTGSKTGSRQGSVSWTDNSGNLWLFGGYGYDDSTSGILNDLWKISSYNVPLPIKILEFTGSYNNGITNLKWSTEQEVSFSHFNIQRSFDGIHFTTIGAVNALGNQTRNQYNFADADLSHRAETKVYYRLQLNDVDGKYSFTKVIMFSLAQQKVGLRLYPNPAVNEVTVALNLEKATTAQLLLSDMKGMIVKKLNPSLGAGNNSLSVDCSNYASGTYLLTIIMADGTRMNEKLIIRH